MASMIERKIAVTVQSFIRKLPNALTDRLKPLGMPKPYYRIARKNPYSIPINLTQQSTCVKYCGKCKSNPFTHGGLYCTTGKSKKQVEERGCDCFDCPLYEQCGGGKAYYCKYGSAAEQGILVPQTQGSSTRLSAKGSNDDYNQRFISKLMEQEAKKKEGHSVPLETKETKKVQLKYVDNLSREEKAVEARTDQTILETSLTHKIDHTHQCGGNARCSTCRVLLIEGEENTTAPTKNENTLLQKKGLPSNIRLACQTKLIGPAKVRLLIQGDADINDAEQEGVKKAASYSVEKDVCVLFADVRNFTSFSESQYPYDVVHMLNKYFDEVGGLIEKNNGFIDKYIGDGIMVLFGLDGSPEQAIKNGIDSALLMNEYVKKLNSYMETHFEFRFKIGVGLHFGSAILGNIGYHRKKDFTAIGDTVNTASRIETATKAVGCDILVSQACYDFVKDQYNWNEKDAIKLKGKTEPLKLYEPLSKGNLFK